MITEVLPNIYTFSIDLPNSPLKQINSYVIKGREKHLLIDTSFNQPICLEYLLEKLAELDITLDKLEVIITHLHVDHAGLCYYFADNGCRVYASSYDGKIINMNATHQDYLGFDNYGKLYGMEKGEVDWWQTPNCLHRPNHATKFIVLDPGMTYSVGDYHFEVLDLIGHTPGHIGLYDKQKGIIFSGDTVLDPITPNICYWTQEHPVILNSYFNTLKQIEKLECNVLLASHRRIINNPKERIQTLLKHHEERLQEILDVMNENRFYTVKEIASRITWRIKANSWQDFAPAQKWFAGGETMAHLEYLAAYRYLKMINEDNVLYFYPINRKLNSLV